ncbi:GNAT family N-acetyltransferase [Algirhabdus cladophorae]|uniref:GNAT family N-acetyltransferase n=1 Tax=Algirhabdus cladophorae TaxID=3377108 RepID=UPI003B8486FE
MIDPRLSVGDAPFDLRRATAADGPFVLWLEEVSMKDYAIALWGSWRPSATLENVDLSNHQIVSLDGQAIGCVAYRLSNQYLLLNRIFLAPAYQNRGFGAVILKEVTELADSLGLATKLDVLTTNTSALKFYLREGFTISKVTAEKRTLIK